MWTNHILLGFLGIVSGSAVAAGTFAFLTVIGVLPRMIGKTKLENKTGYFENVVVSGGIVGNILSVFLQLRFPQFFRIGFGNILLGIAGLSIGIFIGCSAVALAEILNTFPILFRRFHLKEGLSWVMCMLALGKMCGAFYFFLQGLSA